MASTGLAACGSDATSIEAGGQTTVVDTPGGPDDGEDGGDVAPDLAPDDVVMVWTETGGCAMAGPNCARYEILADGTVTTYREGESEVAATGTIDEATVMAWVAEVQRTDTEALVSRLGPGEMTAAFDGIDFFLDVPFIDFELSSVDKEFAGSEPFFEAATGLAQAAASAAPLEIAMR